MPDRPPGPPNPFHSPGSHPQSAIDDRVVVTTEQLATALENSLCCRIDESSLDDLLLDLDRAGYVDWVAMRPSGVYVWDLTDTPERLGDAIASALLERVRRHL